MDNILIIGFGKVGSAIYNSLLNKSAYHLAIYDNQLEAPELQPRLNENLVRNANLIIIAVPDDAIEGVVQELVSYPLNHKIIIHISGMVPLNVLDPLLASGAETAVLHPLQSFSRRNADPSIWQDIWCSFEGTDSAKEVAIRLTDSLGSKLVSVTSSQKEALHVAAVFTANLPVVLFAAAEKILSDAHLDKALLEPLMQNVLNNYQAHPADQILSGPLQRGDAETVQAHLDFLDKPAYADLKKLYQNLAAYLLNNPQFDIHNRDELTRILEEQ